MFQDTQNTVLRWIIIGGIFLIPFIPLIVAPSMFFPFITGKNFTFRIIVEIIFAAWFMLLYRDASYRPKFSWIFAAIGVFLATMTIADIFGENPAKSIWSNFERMEGLVALLHLGAYSLVAGTVLTTEKIWSWFAHTSVGASVIVSIYALSQLIGQASIHQGSRLDATFGNASYLAVYMLFHIFLLAFLFARHAGAKWIRWIYGIIIILETVVLYNTATRGTILGLIGGVLLAALLIALLGKQFPRARKIAALSVLAVAVFIAGFFAVKDAEFVKKSPVLSRFASISYEDTTTQSRFIIWGMAFDGWKENPVFGWGQENFNLIFNKYYKPILYKQEPWFDRAHNVFLDWLTAGGLLGLISYLSLFAAIAWYLWRSNTFTIIEKSIFTGLLAGYFFHNLFVFDNIISYLLFFSLLGYFYSVSIRGENNEMSVSKTPPSHIAVSIMSVVVLATLVFGVYFINVRGVLASRNLLEALKGHQEGLSANLSFFKKALSYEYGMQEANEQLLQFASDANTLSNVPDEISREAVALAQESMALQIQKQPNDARLLLFYGSFLAQNGQYEKGLEILARAESASPEKQLIKIAIGNVHLANKNYESALTFLQKAFEIDTGYQRAWEAYMIAAVYADRRDIEEELLKYEFSKTAHALSDGIIGAYAANGRYKELVSIWEQRVLQAPDNPQYNLSLAASYAQNRQFNKAIESIQKVIELNSEFKAQGEYYISELRAGRIP